MSIRSINSGNKNNGQNQKEVTVSLDETEVTECTKCNSKAFVPAAKFGKLSPAHPKNPTGKARFIPFQTYVCGKCGTEADLKNAAI